MVSNTAGGDGGGRGKAEEVPLSSDQKISSQVTSSGISLGERKIQMTNQQILGDHGVGARSADH